MPSGQPALLLLPPFANVPLVGDRSPMELRSEGRAGRTLSHANLMVPYRQTDRPTDRPTVMDRSSFSLSLLLESFGDSNRYHFSKARQIHHFRRLSLSELLALKHESRILRQSSNPVCGLSVMKQVRLCAVCPTENWLGSSVNQIQCWMTV